MKTLSDFLLCFVFVFVLGTTKMANKSFFSTLLFQWMNISLKTGSERAIYENDLFPLEEENTTRVLTERLRANWTKETANSKRQDIWPRLWKSVLRMLTTKDLVLLFTAGIFWTICRVLQPLLLGFLIKSLMTAEPHNMYYLYGSASALGVNELICCLSMHQFGYRCEVLGIRISSALKGLVYMKVMKIMKKWKMSK